MVFRTATVSVAFFSALAVLSAQSPADLAEQLIRASTLHKDGRYADALKSFVAASNSPEESVANDARKGIVLSALRIGEFTLARQTASTLSRNTDADSLTLSGDALWAAGFVQAVVFGVSPRDPFTMAAAVALLTVVSGLACSLPARRASRVEPMDALRQQ